ncbi:MAG TPA: sialidase family protein [Thermoleophilaceae bacterium]|nr:sialidase family protein [Thermoleophilaceae bacterium]
MVIAGALAGAGAGVPAAHGDDGGRVVLTKRISRAPALPRDCLVRGAGTASTDIEPQVAADPRDPRHLAVVWSVFQPGAFGPRATRVAVTRDGGHSWRLGLQRGVDSCTGNPLYSASGGHNPTLSFGPRGSLYVQSQSGRAGAPGFGAEALWVSASRDGGRRWRRTASPMGSDPVFGIPDQARISADQRRPGTLYLMSQVSDPARYATSNMFWGKAYFTRSEDAGRTWAAPGLAYVPTGDVARAPLGNSVVRLRDGTLLDVFSEVNGSGALLHPSGADYPNRIYAIRSGDGGRTWSVPAPIAGQVAEYPAQPLVHSPNGLDEWGVDTYVPAAQLAADGRTVYVAWAAHARDGSSHSTLHGARSDDGGVTWRQLGRIGTSDAAFMPAIALAGDGTVGMTWVDLRQQRPDERRWPARAYFASSTDRGETWTERPLSGTMDLRTERPRLGKGAFLADFGAGAVFLADYNGLTGLPHGFAAAFAVTRPLAREGATDIRVAKIRTEP